MLEHDAFLINPSEAGGMHNMIETLRTENQRLREALEEISATFNKPRQLLKREPAMIAYAALKHET